MTTSPDSPVSAVPDLSANAVLEQQVKQRQLLFAQPLIGGASLLGIEGGRERNQLREGGFNGRPVLLAVVVRDDLLVLLVVVHP